MKIWKVSGLIACLSALVGCTAVLFPPPPFLGEGTWKAKIDPDLTIKFKLERYVNAYGYGLRLLPLDPPSDGRKFQWDPKYYGNSITIQIYRDISDDKTDPRLIRHWALFLIQPDDSIEGTSSTIIQRVVALDDGGNIASTSIAHTSTHSVLATREP